MSWSCCGIYGGMGGGEQRRRKGTLHEELLRAKRRRVLSQVSIVTMGGAVAGISCRQNEET